jgi:hypothetical protein
LRVVSPPEHNTSIPWRVASRNYMW